MTEPRESITELTSTGKILLLLLLLAAGWLRWHTSVLEEFVKPDETVYVSAAAFWSAGESPYEEPIYFYPPVFAWAASELTEKFGTIGYLKIQRSVNLMGICGATWIAVLIASWRWWPALILGVGWICLSPIVALPIAIGNATGLSTALVLVCLWFWPRRPLGAGAALGFGLAIKPIAPLVPLCLLAHQPGRHRSKAIATALASLVAGGLLMLVGIGYLPGLLGNAVGSDAQPYNFSLHRVLAGFGLNLPPIVILVLIGLAGVWWINRGELSKLEFVVIVIVLNLFTAPILWAHSLLLFLPIQLLALVRIKRSMQLGAARQGLRAAAPHILAVLALASTVLAASVGGLTAAPTWIQSLVLTVPLASLVYLGTYVLAGLRSRTDQRRLSQSP